jgi:hypothetical protein
VSWHAKLRELDLHGPARERVVNQSGVAIPALKVVKMVGYDTATSFPLVAPITSLLDCPRGITKGAIQNGEDDFISSYSIMSGIDTSSYSLEQKLYSDANGNLQTTQTTLFIAQVINVDATEGALFVKPEVVESATMLKSEEFEDVNIAANSTINVNSATLSKIVNVEVIDSSNNRITDAISIDIVDSPVRATLFSLVALSNLTVRLSGDV